MPTIRRKTTLGANETNANIIQGDQFEFISRPTRVQVYALAEFEDFVDIEVFFSQELQIARSELNSGATAGAGARVPDDLILDDVAMPNDRLVIGMTETAGVAATVVRTMVVLTPVA